MHFSELNHSVYIKRYTAVLYYDVFSLKGLKKTKNLWRSLTSVILSYVRAEIDYFTLFKPYNQPINYFN